MAPLFVPKGSINKLYSFLRRILLVTEATSMPGKVCKGVGRTVWEGVGVWYTLPLGAWLAGFGGFVAGSDIYTLRGTRPRRIQEQASETQD